MVNLFVKLNDQVFKVICEDHLYENDKIKLWIFKMTFKDLPCPVFSKFYITLFQNGLIKPFLFSFRWYLLEGRNGKKHVLIFLCIKSLEFSLLYFRLNLILFCFYSFIFPFNILFPNFSRPSFFSFISFYSPSDLQIFFRIILPFFIFYNLSFHFLQCFLSFHNNPFFSTVPSLTLHFFPSFLKAVLSF